jgi:hypothetical protein
VQIIVCETSAVSFNDYTEMFIFGGIVSSGEMSEIWKFKYSDYSWEKVGNIAPR